MTILFWTVCYLLGQICFFFLTRSIYAMLASFLSMEPGYWESHGKIHVTPLVPNVWSIGIHLGLFQCSWVTAECHRMPGSKDWTLVEILEIILELGMGVPFAGIFLQAFLIKLLLSCQVGCYGDGMMGRNSAMDRPNRFKLYWCLLLRGKTVTAHT